MNRGWRTREGVKKRIFYNNNPHKLPCCFKALNHWFKRWVSNNTFRLFLTFRNLAHQHQSELPFYYALGQRLYCNHAHCRGILLCQLKICFIQFLYQFYTSKTKFFYQHLFSVQNVAVRAHKNPLTDSWQQEAEWRFYSFRYFYFGTKPLLLLYNLLNIVQLYPDLLPVHPV